MWTGTTLDGTNIDKDSMESISVPNKCPWSDSQSPWSLVRGGGSPYRMLWEVLLLDLVSVLQLQQQRLNQQNNSSGPPLLH